jgi:hypothetical protein
MMYIPSIKNICKIVDKLLGEETDTQTDGCTNMIISQACLSLLNKKRKLRSMELLV